MNSIFQMVLSMSLSGTVLILALFLGRQFWKGRLDRQWQYYIWLVVLLRLFLPFGPEASLMGQAYQMAERVMSQMTGVTREAHLSVESPAERQKQSYEQGSGQSLNQSYKQSEAESYEQSMGQDVSAFLSNKVTIGDAAAIVGRYLWMIWIVAAFAILIRKITAYQTYIRFVTAGAEPVSDTALFDQLAVTAQEMRIGRPIELQVNPLVASPMLAGFFHPCIILPCANVSQKEFQYIVMHELTHYKRLDIWYKWLVQLAVCQHWFNPFVYVMRREIERACEFACDEAVIRRTGYDQAKDYGETLLNAMAAVGAYREPFAAVTMSANKELLKERLSAVMNCKKRTKKRTVMTAGLTVGIVAGMFFLGVYTAVAAEPDMVKVIEQSNKTKVSEPDKIKAAAQSNRDSDEEAAFSVPDKAKEVDDRGGISAQERTDNVIKKNGEKGKAEQEAPTPKEQTSGKETAIAKVEDLEKYYKGRSLPMFHIAFYELDENEQEAWLNRIYADGEIDFFSVSVWQLNADSPLIQSFAEKFYAEDDIAFFSVLADQMEEEALEKWLDRALADEKWNFQSMLYDELGREEELDTLEKTLEEEQLAQYRAVGVTQNGKNYYYEGQLVNIFLDIHRPNQSFYTLNMNPAGAVNIKIVRAQDGQITGVAYMTEAEVEELLGDLYGEDE